ncbi:unnamed protein product, partial [Iphiclides podalirius]
MNEISCWDKGRFCEDNIRDGNVSLLIALPERFEVITGTLRSKLSGTRIEECWVFNVSKYRLAFVQIAGGIVRRLHFLWKTLDDLLHIGAGGGGFNTVRAAGAPLSHVTYRGSFRESAGGD